MERPIATAINEEPLSYIDDIHSEIIDHIGVFYYHKRLHKFLEAAKFTPSKAMFELFCKMNPGYSFLSVEKSEDISLLIAHHKPYLEKFFKFNLYSRVIEIIQTYTDRMFAVPKRLIGSPTVQLESTRLKIALMVPRELFEKVQYFIDYIDSGRDAIRDISGFKRTEGYHAEVFDNHVRDLRSFCNMCIDTDIMQNRRGDFRPITDYMYMRLVRWLCEHADCIYSPLQRDNDQIIHMLYTFICLHHIHYLCGTDTKAYPENTYGSSTPEGMFEVIEESRSPLRAFERSNKFGAMSRRGDWVAGRNTMEYDNYRNIEEKMYYYGNLTPGECLCTRCGIMPTMNKQRIANMDIIQFLSFQTYLFETRSNRDRS